MPPELKERLERLAAESDRSLNAEIVHRLERSVNGEAQPGVDGAQVWAATLNYDELAEALLRQAKQGEEHVAIHVEKRTPAPRAPQARKAKKA
jgi:predicted DNA-binding protein